MHDVLCEGSGTLEHVRPRPDGGMEPLPCPVCDQQIRTIRSLDGAARVYDIHWCAAVDW